MEFFNKKEEVIDIQLTSYGRFLYSVGKFKPEYYSFHDTDITYDGRYGNILEGQNRQKERIIESQRMHTQANFKGIETNRKENSKEVYIHPVNINPQINDFFIFNPNLGNAEQIRNVVEDLVVFARAGSKAPQVEKTQPTRDFHALTMPLGSSALSELNNPAWNIRFLKGEISRSETIHTGSISNKAPILRIPQLHVEMKYKTHVKILENNELREPESPIDEEAFSLISDDGSYIELEENFLVIQIDEENGIFDRENFEIEVFEKREFSQHGAGTVEQLILLPFVLNEEATANARNANYYLSIEVDEEIDNNTLCSLRAIAKKQGILEDDDIECIEELESLTDIYAIEKENEEICD